MLTDDELAYNELVNKCFTDMKESIAKLTVDYMNSLPPIDENLSATEYVKATYDRQEVINCKYSSPLFNLDRVSSSVRIREKVSGDF